MKVRAFLLIMAYFNKIVLIIFFFSNCFDTKYVGSVAFVGPP